MAGPMFGCALLLAAGGASAVDLDDRLIVQAEFAPAEGSDWRPWRLTIEDSGVVEMEVPELAPHRRRLAGSEIQRLLTIMERARFEELESEYRLPVDGDAVAHPDTLTLSVRTPSGYREVRLELPEYAVGLEQVLAEHPRRSEIKRFLRVWARVLREVRPPNPDQSGSLYRP